MGVFVRPQRIIHIGMLSKSNCNWHTFCGLIIKDLSMKNIFGIITISLITILCSCYKKLENKPVDAGLEAAFSFAPGTYWVFRDSISGQMDSLFVKARDHENHAVGNPNDPWYYSYDEIIGTIYEVKANPSKAPSQLEIFLKTNELVIEYFDGSKYYDYDPIKFPFVSGNYSDQFTEYVNIIGDYSINGNNFKNVTEVNISSGRVYTDSLINGDHFYLNSDIGFIKMVFNHPFDTLNNVWELQRWKIVK